MATLKTKPGEGSVTAFLQTITNETKRTDCLAIFDNSFL